MLSDFCIEIQENILIDQSFIVRSSVLLFVGGNEMNSTESSVDSRIQMLPVWIKIESQAACNY